MATRPDVLVVRPALSAGVVGGGCCLDDEVLMLYIYELSNSFGKFGVGQLDEKI